jgi:glycosyltransferase involved in cell wall biosynthesis
VILHGIVPHAEIPAALAALDVLVLPSVWLENAPLVIEEAFLAGVPVVASDLGGMAERVEHGRSGLLFRAGDPLALRRTLARLEAEPGLLERLRAGLPRVESMEEDAAETRALYERLHQPPSPEPPR